MVPIVNMIHQCQYCNYQSPYKWVVRRHEKKHFHLPNRKVLVQKRKRMKYCCTHCNYNSERMYNLKVHQSRKHKMIKEEVVEHPLPMQSKEQSTDWEPMEDSIEVFKIYKLLQRMKN